MHPVGFEPTISAGERPQTYALDRAVCGYWDRPVICSENPKLNGDSTIAIVEAKTTLARVYEFTVTVEHIG